MPTSADYLQQQQYLQQQEDGSNIEEQGERTQAYSESVSSDVIKFQLGFEFGHIMDALDNLGVKNHTKNQLIMILRSALNHNTYLSNYDEEMVEIMVRYTVHTINDLLLEYMENHSCSLVDSIVISCELYIKSALRRPLNQGERMFLGKTSEIKSIIQSKPEGRKKLLGNIFNK